MVIETKTDFETKINGLVVITDLDRITKVMIGNQWILVDFNGFEIEGGNLNDLKIAWEKYPNAVVSFGYVVEKEQLAGQFVQVTEGQITCRVKDIQAIRREY